MKYYVKIYDEQGDKTSVYNEYGITISLKVDEDGFLEIPPKAYGENGYPFRIVTNAKKIECSYSEIFQIEANEATYIECNSCGIRYLEAEKVEKLECNGNPLDYICVPNAIDIEVYNCPILNEINAPKCEKISCSDCCFDDTVINEQDFPALQDLTISHTNIKEIKHSTLKTLNSKANKLSYLEVPNVEYISLLNENKLHKLNVPQAKYVDCGYSSLETIIADKAETLQLTENRFLKEVFAENVEFISIIDCDFIEVLQIPKETPVKGVTKTMETIFNLRR